MNKYLMEFQKFGRKVFQYDFKLVVCSFYKNHFCEIRIK
ncbi:hypothetical protein HPHPH43_1506 [Helicobacter pylori Hp H-43]|nr:hypothetical protein HPHPH43_1506 [Helicobacter pylori Hp H-43]